MEKKYDLVGIFKILFKHWYVFVIGIVIFGSIGFLYGEHTYSPIYTAKAKVLIYHPEKKLVYKKVKLSKKELKKIRKHNKNSKRTHKKVYLAQRREDIDSMTTYANIVASSKILKPVQQKMSQNKAYKESQSFMNGNVWGTVEKTDSLVLTIQARGKTAKLATQTTNMTVKIFQKKLNKVVKNSGTVYRLDDAQISDATVSSSKTIKYTVLGVLGGAYLALIYMLFTLKYKIK
jgi:capsular polysaccharide biosynthesis protein